MSETVFLELAEDVGLEADVFHKQDKSGLYLKNPKAGEPAPLQSVGINIPVPAMVGKDVVTDVAKLVIRPAGQLDPSHPLAARIIPDSRIIETTNPAVVDVLRSTGHYEVCDPPKATQRTSSEKKGGE